MTPTPRLSAGLLLAAVAAAAWYAKPAADTPGSPGAAPLTVTAPYTHDNLTVYVVRGKDEFDAGNVMTLQEALEKGLAVVHETGDVNTLAVENRSDDQELFLQSGDIVKGGRQDRLIASDLLLPPKSGKVACPANCCERSRWSGRGQEAADKFAQSTDFAVGNPIKIANAARQQGEVWENVEKAQKQLSENVGKAVNAPASPTSLQLALEDKDLRAKLAGYEKGLAGVAAYPDAVGVVVAVNGQVIAADVYGSAKLFKKVWPKLLKAAAADALAQRPKDGPIPAAPPPAEAEKFLATAAAGAQPAALELPREAAGLQMLTDGGQTEINADQRARAADPVQRGLTAIPAPSPDARAEALTELGLLAERAQQPAAQRSRGGEAADNVELNRTFAGRGEAAAARVIRAGRGRPSLNPAAPALPAPARAAQPGIVVVESAAPSAPGATVHRSYLKK